MFYWGAGGEDNLVGEERRLWVEGTPRAGGVGRISACEVVWLFFCCGLKYTDKRNLKRKEGRKDRQTEESFSVHSSRVVHPMRKSKRQELEAAGPIAPAGRKQMTPAQLVSLSWAV